MSKVVFRKHPFIQKLHLSIKVIIDLSLKITIQFNLVKHLFTALCRSTCTYYAMYERAVFSKQHLKTKIIISIHNLMQ